MPEWRPGELAAILAEIDATGRASQRTGLLKIAAAIEAAAKAKLGETSHPAGTRSPAKPGGPPSLVTGAGRRSIGHQYEAALEAVVKVGTIAGVYPPATTSRRGSRSVRSDNTTKTGKTATSTYLLYQEKDPRFNHPFLVPAFRSVIDESAVAIWLESFRKWPRLL